MMLSGVPNFAMAVGYTNASWTLKVQLIFDYLVRMWRHMDRNDFDVAIAIAPDGYQSQTSPLLDLEVRLHQTSRAPLAEAGAASALAALPELSTRLLADAPRTNHERRHHVPASPSSGADISVRAGRYRIVDIGLRAGAAVHPQLP